MNLPFTPLSRHCLVQDVLLKSSPIHNPATGLFQHVIYRCVMGSRAYGLEEETSDTDRRGIYLAPADLHWSLPGAPEQIENTAAEECYWELQKFLNLALKANPNILECLYSPLVETATPLAQELLEMRSIFLSRLVHQTYSGYAKARFELFGRSRERGESVRWKHAMHLIRLLLAGKSVLEEQVLPVRVEEHRDRLMAIRRGEMPWDEMDRWRIELHEAMDRAALTTGLPERPDYDRANRFLIRARRWMATNAE